MEKKFDFDVELKTLDGRTIVQNDEPVKLKMLVANTLCLIKPKKAEDIARQFSLALRIYEAKEALSVDDNDIRLIKDAMMASDLTPIVAGQIITMLDK